MCIMGQAQATKISSIQFSGKDQILTLNLLAEVAVESVRSAGLLELKCGCTFAAELFCC